MRDIVCQLCRDKGHGTAYCPKQTCSKCGVMGHGPTARICQKQ
jgi:hypothetical protein